MKRQKNNDEDANDGIDSNFAETSLIEDQVGEDGHGLIIKVEEANSVRLPELNKEIFEYQNQQEHFQFIKNASDEQDTSRNESPTNGDEKSMNNGEEL